MICVWVILFLWGISACGESAQAVRAETIQAADISEAVSSGDASAAEIQITDQLELTRLQDMVDAMLGENSFSVTDAFHRLLSGERGRIPHENYGYRCRGYRQLSVPCIM